MKTCRRPWPIYVLAEEVDAWIDGHFHPMKAGDLAAFPHGTAICNRSSTTAAARLGDLNIDECPRIITEVSSSSPFRFGALHNDRSAPHVYPGVWEIEHTTGPDRLVLAPAGQYVDLLVSLVTSMHEPYGLLHVLLASRCGRESGRYQTREPMDARKMRTFLRSYAEYLEHDGRHHTWFFGLGDEQQVIYDNHNLIYCYGDIDRFRAIAEDSGLTQGTAQIPAPHEHRYNREFDAEEDRIFSEIEWIHFPLEPGDDP